MFVAVFKECRGKYSEKGFYLFVYLVEVILDEDTESAEHALKVRMNEG